MNTTNEFSEISQAVINGDSKEVSRLVRTNLDKGLPPNDLLDELVFGIKEVGNLFGNGEYFLPDLMIGAKAMKSGLEILEPELNKETQEERHEDQVAVVLGTVKGDLHDIGKNLVSLMLEINGYRVYDLGVDVSVETFIAEINRTNADVVGLSSLLTTTAPYMSTFIETADNAGMRDKVKIIVGGAATSSNFAKKIGADGWAENAADAVNLVKSLTDRSTE
jgi:5-methyltetrahydrofolate--homocysteine methyltransferase